MNRLATAACTCALLVLSLSCSTGSGPASDDDTWVGTITTEGNVTTVVNESGSVWGGTARLVEEASIGVEAGAEEYLLDVVSFAYATEKRIYVSQPRIPIVRMYDRAGRFVGNLGAPGQGPGEYGAPTSVAAGAGERAFVWDIVAGRINVYGANAEPADTWLFRTSGGSWPMALSAVGQLRVPLVEYPRQGQGETRFGVQTFGERDPVIGSDCA